jgi:CBS domain-containing protein
VFLSEVVSLCKMIYLNLPEATGVVGLWSLRGRSSHAAAEGLRALPVAENGMLVGMLTIEDVGPASLLRQPKRR